MSTTVTVVNIIAFHSSTHQEIIHQLMEQGLQFSQKDYANALTLLANSSQTKYPEEKLREELVQLDTIFSKDAV